MTMSFKAAVAKVGFAALALSLGACNPNAQTVSAPSGADTASPPASVQATDTDYFKGKTVTYIVATGPGGGDDTYSRLIAKYLQKYLPGSRVLVRNVPGAGHIVGANTIYA